MNHPKESSSETIICFTAGLSTGEIQKATQVFDEVNREAAMLKAVALTQMLLAMPVGMALEGVRAGIKPPDLDRPASGPGDCRVVLIDTASRDQVISVMRSFKAVVKESRNLIFAVITETARSWTFEDYFGHLIAEHELMKKRNPENNPDMKKL